MKLRYDNKVELAIMLESYRNTAKSHEAREELFDALKKYIEDLMKESALDAMREPRMHVGYTAAQVKKAIVKELESLIDESDGYVAIVSKCKVKERIKELKQE